MKAVIQRVTRASVEVEGEVIGSIAEGLVLLLGVAKGDTAADADALVDKVAGLRIFADEQGKMNRSIREVGGALLVVSQFTLLGDTAKGRRPGFDDAAPPDAARVLYERVIAGFKTRNVPVATGRFGAHMRVELVNDGPVTFLVESRRAPDRSSPSDACR
jgi:D-tyrosyl-tRNA(Tyr) deacylase